MRDLLQSQFALGRIQIGSSLYSRDVQLANRNRFMICIIRSAAN